MMPSATMPQSAALVEGVAQALTWAINDPLGHSAWNTSVCHTLSLTAIPELKSKRLRGERETMHAATVFDSSVVPPIGIDKYLMRLRSAFRCSDASFIAAFILVDRVLGYDGGRLPLSMRNVHRLYLACLVVAVKYHEDLVYTNSHYAKAGGVHLREVNRLERVLLSALDFDLRVPPEQYQIYEASLVRMCSPVPVHRAQLSGDAIGGASSTAPWRATTATVLTPVHGTSSIQHGLPAMGASRGNLAHTPFFSRGDQSRVPTPPTEAAGRELAAAGKDDAEPPCYAAGQAYVTARGAAPSAASVSAFAADALGEEDRAAAGPQLGISGGGWGAPSASAAGHISSNRRRRRRPGRVGVG